MQFLFSERLHFCADPHSELKKKAKTTNIDPWRRRAVVGVIFRFVDSLFALCLQVTRRVTACIQCTGARLH